MWRAVHRHSGAYVKIAERASFKEIIEASTTIFRAGLLYEGRIEEVLETAES